MSYMAEQQVIGSLLMDNGCISDIYGLLEADMFTSEILGRIYKEFQRAYDNCCAIDIPIIEQNLRSDNFPSDLIIGEIKECMINTITSAKVKQNANVIVNDYKANRLDKFLNSIKVSPTNIKE